MNKTSKECEEEIKYILGNKFRELREAKGLSLQQLSEMAHLRPGHIQKIEEGRYYLRVNVAHQLAKALGCRLDIVPND